jgi:lambda family phage portal protein
MTANWLDKTIGWFAPQAAVRRIQARAVIEQQLAYDGVGSDRRMGGRVTLGSSGNRENGGAIAKLRANARDLDQNNAYIRKAKRRRSKRVVGYGITPQADTGDEKLNRRVDEFWGKWVRQCMSDHRTNFYGAQQLIVETEFIAGECLVRIWDRRLSDGLDVPFQIQLLEPDYLDTLKTVNLDNGNYVIQGVQYDAIGRITGYWLFGQHPGEVLTVSTRGISQSAFVPSDRVIHHLQVERPGNSRAVTRLSPVIAKTRDVAEYSDAEIVRKKAAACVIGAVTAPGGTDGETLAPTMTDAQGRKVEQFRPGMMLYGSPGAETEFFAPPDSGDYAAHKKAELREIAAGLDLPYVVMAEDLSDTNYSSYRAGLIDERDGVEQYRWNWFIPQVLDPIWRKFIDTLVLMGEMPEPLYGVKWNPPAFDLLDRESEAKADMIELQIGKKTWPQLIGDQGLDPREQVAAIAAYKPQLDDAGVNFFPNSGAQNVQQNQA